MNINKIIHTSRTICIENKMPQDKTNDRDVLSTILKIPQYQLDAIISPVAYLDTDFNFIRVNKSYAEADNRTPDFFFGKNHFALYPNDENLRIFKGVVESGQPYKVTVKPFEYIETPERGTTYWDWELHPIKNNHNEIEVLSLSLVDVTEKVKAIKDLVKYRDSLEVKVKERTSELTYDHARFTTVIDTAADGIVISDTKGIILTFNKSASRLFGYSQEEAIGQNVTILMPKEFSTKHDHFIFKHIETNENKIVGSGREVLGMRKDGKTFPMYISVSRIESQNKCMGFTGIIHDLTKKKLEIQELFAAKEAAEFANQAKSNFLAVMSHEIRTPLSAIIGYSELELTEESIPENSRQNLEKINQSALHLLTIINDILDLSKLESGKIKFETINFSLINLINKTFLVFENQLKEKGLLFNLKIASDIPPCVSGDPTRLRQIIMNLLSNAIKFTDKGEIIFECRNHEIGNTLYFSITDTGIGLSEEQIKTIFDSFTQADNSTTRLYGGTGLGTSISKHLVEEMGGKIWLESEPGKGSKFHFTVHLPAVDNCEDTDLSIAQANNLNNETPLIKESTHSSDILLIEDNPFNQELIRQQLNTLGFTADIAENGKAALQQMENKYYRLLISDISMPIMDGYELVTHIRNSEKGTDNHQTVIAVTANAMDGENQKCIEKGFDDYCSKPISLTTLKQKLEKWMEPL